MHTTARWLATSAVIASIVASGTLVTPMDTTQGASSAPALVSFEYPDDPRLADAQSWVVEATPPTFQGDIDVSPYLERLSARLDGLATQTWDLATGAAGLGSDPAAAFEFVRDRIGFDAYPGVLRGAAGTLAARSGNAYDRALLLRALLDASGATTRLAFGVLDGSQAAAVIDRGLAPPVAPLPGDPLGPLSEAQAEALIRRATRDLARLRTALGDRLVTMTGDERAQAQADVTRHAWVQVLDPDGTWVDLDPTMPDSAPGTSLVAATTTADQVPEADRQALIIRVVAETLEDGYLYEYPSLDQRLDAAEAATRTVLLTFAPQSSGGGGLLGSVGAPTSLVPLLWVDDTPTAGTGFPFMGGDTGGGFGLGGSSTVDLVGLRLEVEAVAPGVPALTSTRTILDRVPAAARRTGSVTRDQLLPMPLLDETYPPIAASVSHLIVSTGGLDPMAVATASGNATAFAAVQLAGGERFGWSLTQLLSPITTADTEVALTSERAIVDGLDGEHARVFVDRPRLTTVAMGPRSDDPGRFDHYTDLTLDRVRVLTAGDADAALAPRIRMWYAALETALETQHGVGVAAALQPDTRALDGVSLRMDEPLVVLDPADAASLPDSTAPSLVATLTDGATIVVPGDPASALTWWSVRSDGTTLSIAAPDGRQFGISGLPITPGGWVQTSPTVLIDWQFAAEAEMHGGGIEYQAVNDTVAIESIATIEEITSVYIELMEWVAAWLRFPPL